METHFTTDHEWIAVAGNTATIGITHFAQLQLGDLIFIELPTVGQQLKAGDVAGTVESGKSVSDLFAPLAGEVVEINNGIVEDPSLVNADAMSAWFFRIRLDEPTTGPDAFMDADQYAAYTK